MTISIVNLILCVSILALGIWVYVKKRNNLVLFIGIAFGLFGVTHLMDIIGLPASLLALVIAIRLVAYLLVIFAIFRYLIRDIKA